MKLYLNEKGHNKKRYSKKCNDIFKVFLSLLAKGMITKVLWEQIGRFYIPIYLPVSMKYPKQ